MIKKKFSISVLILVILTLTGCNESLYRGLVDNEFNSNVGVRDFTQADIPREGWSEVGHLSSDGREKKAFLRLADEAEINLVYVHGYYWKGKYSYFDSVLDGYLRDGLEDEYNILAVELSGWGQQKMHRFEDFAYDILGGVEYLKEIDPDIPTVIVGHSMGGYAVLLGAYYDDNDLVDGVVALAPAINMATAAKYREIDGQREVPWYKRIFIDRIDSSLDNFFYGYDIKELAGDIDIPVLILTGKDDDPPFPAMSMEIYENLEGEKDFYLLDNTLHSWLNFYSKEKVDKTLSEFFAKIISGDTVDNRELDLSTSVKDNNGSFKLKVELNQDLIEGYKPVDLALRDGLEFADEKIIFGPNKKEASFNISFNPTDIYGVSPENIELKGDIWNYNFSREEEAFYLLSKSEASSYEQLKEDELYAIDLLASSDEIFYRGWLANYFLLKDLGAYQESIQIFKSLLDQDIHQNLEVEYTYYIYQIYRDRLKDFQKAASFYNRLIEYEDDKYYVAKAKDYESRNLDYNKSYKVSELRVEGLERSDESLVLKQLSYSKGQGWDEDKKRLTKERLHNSALFNPLSLKVEDIELKEGEVGVNISVEDRNSFMVHPFEFALLKVIDISNSQITQSVINPFGNGVNLNLGYSWKSDPDDNFFTGPWWEVGGSYVGSEGRVYSVKHKDFESSEEFNNKEYNLDGFNIGVKFSQIISTDLKVRSNLNYQKNDYEEGINKLEQEYILLGGGLDIYNYGHFSLDLDYGLSLNDEPDFKRLALLWRRVKDIGDDKLVYSSRAGIASSDTPLNYQFKGGGYSSIPLRGREFDLAGNKYLAQNIEYHKSLTGDSLWGIIFLEGGKFAGGDWSKSAGLALALETPFGPLRTDLVFDLKEVNRNFNIKLGHTF